MRSLRSALRRILLTLACLALTIASLLGWILYTNTGSAWVVNQIDQQLEPLTIGSFSGTLGLHNVFENVKWAGQTQAHINHASLRWQLTGLISRKLRIQALTLNGIHLQLPPAEPTPPRDANAPLIDLAPISVPQTIPLPLSVTIEALTLSNISVATGDQPPQQIQSIEARAHVTPTQITLDNVAFAGLGINSKIRGNVSPYFPFPLQATIDLDLELPDLPDVQGQLEIAGDLHHLTLRPKIAEPYNITGQLTLGSHASSHDTAQATTAHALQTNQKTHQQNTYLLDLMSLKFALDIDAKKLDTNLLKITPEQHHISASTRVNGTLENMRINLESTVDQKAAIKAQATLKDGTIEGAVTWHDLFYPLSTAQASSSGKVELNGDLNRFKTTMVAKINAPGFPEGTFYLSGAANNKLFTMETLSVQAAGTEVRAKGDIYYGSPLKAALSLNLKQFDPSIVLKDYPGSINAALKTNILFDKNLLTLDSNHISATGSLRGHPLALMLNANGQLLIGDRPTMLSAFQQKKSTLSLKEFDFTLGTASVNLAAAIRHNVQSHWQVNIPDLGHLLPDASGSFQSTGEISGALLTPTILGSTAGRELKWQKMHINSLRLDSNVRFDRPAPSSFDLKLQNLSMGTFTADTLSAQLHGTPTDHKLSLSLASSALNAHLNSQGSLQADAWKFTLQRGEIEIPGMPTWQLNTASGGIVSAVAQELDRQCWQSHPALFCWQAQHEKGQVTAKLAIEQLPISHFQSWLPEGMSVNSNLDGTVDVSHQLTAELPDLAARLSLSPGDITFKSVSAADAELHTIPLAESQIVIDAKDQALTLNTDLKLSKENFLASRLEIPASDTALMSRQIQGETQLVFSDFRLIDHLIDPIDQLTGKLRAGLTLTGSLAQPRMSGTLAVNEGKFNVIDAGLTLENLTAAAQVTPEGTQLSLEASSGEGTLKLQARSASDLTQASNFNDASLTAQLTGQRFFVLNKRRQKVAISPDLNVDYKDRAVHITGVVKIPFADISDVSAGPATGVSASSDQVIITPESEADPASLSAKAAPNIPVHAQVRVEMGDQVSFNEFGLQATLGGSIVVKEHPGQTTSAAGEFRIEKGRFRKLGQDLVIRTGRVIFAGPVTKPGLDFDAVRVISPDLVTGLRARGPVDNIDQFTLFSEPGGLTQADILSYITTGRPLSGGSEGEASVMTQASMALAMTGGKYLTENFGNKLGVDEIGIDTAPGEDTSQAALTIGKYLSPKLYVSSGVGLFQPITTLKLRYSINEKWKFVSEASGDKSSADFVYEIESGD